MNDGIKSRVEKMVLINGDVISMTLNFKKLLYLRANGYEKEVNLAMKSINGKELDMLDMPFVFYAAYLCANSEPAYTQDEFIGLIPWDLAECGMVFNNLNSKKKVKISEKRSSAESPKAT